MRSVFFFVPSVFSFVSRLEVFVYSSIDTSTMFTIASTLGFLLSQFSGMDNTPVVKSD